jgi:hypothetical protein
LILVVKIINMRMSYWYVNENATAMYEHIMK